ncbi:uncharacterized mitochondrial protein AtMg00820-like [Phoenix dactylifera]|uniref:Uncharacterized mitochondrial protein AtMg00820-like n=1 Tax=Phoenix dactylifera TaxID=42345 RepID=A0A8B7MSK0_PHODC|nr:uncharacterized mitochondrial protein AtMg00820-like [Phoenix dactylifera]
MHLALHLLASASADDSEPTCYTEAVKDPKWRVALNSKFDALLKNGTWSLVPSNASRNVVGCKWVFKMKRNADGSINRYKARLVAKGFHQQEGMDFSETFSLVIKPATIRLVLSLVVSLNWHILQIDIQRPFYMVIYWRKSICNNLQNSTILNSQITFAGYISRFMGSNKRREHGSLT